MNNSFEKLGIDEDFNPFFRENGFKSPTDIQSKVIPNLIGRKSIVCVAQTGTGKTLSYVLPLAELIKRDEDKYGVNKASASPKLVIVVPTKELAVQVSAVSKEVSHHARLRVRSLVESTSLSSKAFEILVSTPHKLSHALKNRKMNFDSLEYIVFDEADQVFDMGFKRDIERIISFVDYDKTDVHFFSATMPLDVRDFLTNKFRKKRLTFIESDTAHRVQKRVETFNLNLAVEEKKYALESFIKKTMQGRGIIFVNQRNQVDQINIELKERFPKLKYKIIHGELPEKERIANLKSFRDKKIQVLLASDVAARGMDFKDLDWVLNYGLPKSPIYYLHRCGRVGRAGRSGTVYNFVTKYDTKIIAQINQAIKEQSHLDMGPINLKPVVKKVKSKKPIKSKRIKVTKRTKLVKK